ncbi:hypothetical protein ACFE04_024419 [Oxalis oulophora]
MKIECVGIGNEELLALRGLNYTSPGYHFTLPLRPFIRRPNSRGITLAPTPGLLPPWLLIYMDEPTTYSENIPCEEKSTHNKAHSVYHFTLPPVFPPKVVHQLRTTLTIGASIH